MIHDTILSGNFTPDIRENDPIWRGKPIFK
jgi:hypothetical protein